VAAGGSTKVIVFALVANAGIGVAKLVAWLATSSGAMLAESIHSFADSGNQALLLLGGARAKKPATDVHPLGFGREAYFWALLVAVILFTLGGLFSLYEGVHKLQDPHPVENAGWAIGVLVFAILLEGGSMIAAWREYRRTAPGKGLMEWARTTGDIDLLVVVFEDIAATAGLFLALAAVVLTVVTGNPFWDAGGTCVIGVLLLLVAVFVGAQVRRLIVGFAVPPEMREGIRGIWDEHGFDVLRLIAVWIGPRKVMVAVKVNVREPAETGQELVNEINAAEAEIRGAFPEIGFQFSEPDTNV
jgi:cation diffusion facilitator family transporter